MIGGIQFDVSDLVDKINGLAEYTEGYMSTLLGNQAYINYIVGEASVDALYAYVDAMAAMDHARLAHVYEPGEAGNPDSRLFRLEISEHNESYVEIKATFIESVKPSISGQPFARRAEVMEAGATITVRPKNGRVIVFEDDGETIFTSSAVTIEHPGGPEAERGFADTVQTFFTSVATRMVMEPVMRKLASLDLYERNVKIGVKGGRTEGINTAHLKLSEVKNVTF